MAAIDAPNEEIRTALDVERRDAARSTMYYRERIADLESSLRVIVSRAKFEQDHPTGMHMTCLSLIEKDARMALGENI